MHFETWKDCLLVQSPAQLVGKELLCCGEEGSNAPMEDGDESSLFACEASKQVTHGISLLARVVLCMIIFNQVFLKHTSREFGSFYRVT